MTIREKILIVEDEKSIAHFISTILTTNGYETILAKTGTEAMTMLSSHCPDLVILDLGLPDMDGIEVLRSLRGWSSLPVVVVSARTHENDKVEALDLGADDYLTKPFGTAELLARVRTDYVHQQQERYRAQVSYAEDALATAEKGNRVKLEKRISKLNDQLREASEFEEKVHHLADQMIEIDLDDGVKVNYAKFQDVLAKIK